MDVDFCRSEVSSIVQLRRVCFFLVGSRNCLGRIEPPSTVLVRFSQLSVRPYCASSVFPTGVLDLVYQASEYISFWLVWPSKRYIAPCSELEPFALSASVPPLYRLRQFSCLCSFG